jgi:hypothetical protein
MRFWRREGRRSGKPARAPASGYEPADGLSALLGRYRLGQASFDELASALTDDLVEAQLAGTPLAVAIVRDYTDRLYAATEDAVGPHDAERPARHSLLAPAGRIVSDEDADQPAVPLMSEHWQQLPFSQFTLAEGIHPHIHLTAAARALGNLRSAGEAGGPTELPETLDRAWFLLAFSLNISLGYGRMFDPDSGLIVDLIGCCARLHELSEALDPPAFVRDAADRDLAVRHFASEWVSENRYVTTGGEMIDEGHFAEWDSGLRLPVGALLRERFGGTPAVPADPAAAIAAGRAKAESGDFTAAKTAVESALSNPGYSRQATDLLRELRAEQACRELIAILAQYPAERGSAARQRVVEIGQELHDFGGTEFMREVHAEVTARRRLLSRTLDMIWDGIGRWQG